MGRVRCLMLGVVRMRYDCLSTIEITVGRIQNNETRPKRMDL